MPLDDAQNILKDIKICDCLEEAKVSYGHNDDDRRKEAVIRATEMSVSSTRIELNCPGYVIKCIDEESNNKKRKKKLRASHNGKPKFAIRKLIVGDINIIRVLMSQKNCFLQLLIDTLEKKLFSMSI